RAGGGFRLQPAATCGSSGAVCARPGHGTGARAGQLDGRCHRDPAVGTLAGAGAIGDVDRARGDGAVAYSESAVRSPVGAGLQARVGDAGAQAAAGDDAGAVRAPGARTVLPRTVALSAVSGSRTGGGVP